jgi:PKHD-type hydroxylase
MTTFLSYNPKERSEITYPYCWQGEVFTPSELDAIIEYGNAIGLEEGWVVGADGENATSSNRKSRVKFFTPDGNNNWIFDRLSSLIDSINSRYYGFDLNGFDAIQFTEYGKEGEKYDWHMDTILGNSRSDRFVQTRKLSLTIPINDPSEWEGGEFQLQTGTPEEPMTVEQKRGTAIIFPSFLIHRVTPIVSGVRKSLVIWVVGPKFK